MAPPTGFAPIAFAAVAVIALIVLIARLRLNPFVALVLVSLSLGLALGMPAANIVKAFETGVGATLGHIALVIGLGAILGKMMVESGGADRIAQTLIATFGPKRVDWAMMTVAFLVGLPVFFEVGFVLLMPIVLTVSRRTGTPLIRVGLPMAAGLSVVHGLVPPHPAALLAVTAYHADVGRTIIYALIVGIPTAMIAGPLFARRIAPLIPAGRGGALMAASIVGRVETGDGAVGLPSFGLTLVTLLLPVALMLLGAGADSLAPQDSPLAAALKLAGNPVVALLAAVLLSFQTFGTARGFSRDTILRFSSECLGPTAGVTLVVGAGAGFGRILMDGGVAAAIVTAATTMRLPALVLAWLIAALLRIATGSATVAMATASGIVAPIAAAGAGRPELLVLATGAGSLILSHVNDGGFWLVKEYLGLSVAETLRFWTVCETLISVTALAFTLGLSMLVS